MLEGMPRLFLELSDFLSDFLNILSHTERFRSGSACSRANASDNNRSLQKKDLFLDERSIHFLVGSEGKVSVFVGI